MFSGHRAARWPTTSSNRHGHGFPRARASVRSLASSLSLSGLVGVLSSAQVLVVNALRRASSRKTTQARR